MLATAGPLSAGGEGEGGEVGRGLTPPQPLPTRGEGLTSLDIESALLHGYEFWKERFFLSNGWPKYYPDRLYPADVHSAAAAIVTLVELRGQFSGTLESAQRIADWAIGNMHSAEGYFYYQRHRFFTNRIPYMRWSQAWMAYALGRLLEAGQYRER